MSSDQDGNVRHTTEHTLLRGVIEERDGFPAHLSGSEGEGDSGLPRVGFTDRETEDLEEISWEQFFAELDEKNLVGVYTEDGSDVDDNRPVVLRSQDTVETEE